VHEPCGYEEVEHTADWALRVWGRTFSQLCACAAEGMLSLAGIAPRSQAGEWRPIDLQSDDRESLLVLWLEELLFLIETEHVTFTAFDLSLRGDLHIVGKVLAEPARRPEKPIKAVTFHDLAIRNSKRGLEAVIVFDV
jgi:SHS2 domain-containing protein